MTSPSCPPLPGLVQGLLVMASLSTLCLSFPMPVLGKVSLGPSGCLESPKGTFEGVLRAEGGDPRDQRRGKPQSPRKGTEGTKSREARTPASGNPGSWGKRTHPQLGAPIHAGPAAKDATASFPGPRRPPPETQPQGGVPRPAPPRGHAHSPRPPRPFALCHAPAPPSPQRGALRAEPNEEELN